MSPGAIRHRIASGRLHPLWRGVYAVGRPDVGWHGRCMAAVLSCGPTALLSHGSAAALWGLQPHLPGIDIVVPYCVNRHRPGIRVHRQVGLDTAQHCFVSEIPVTSLVSTLVDLASCVSRKRLERAVNEADRLDLIDPEALRAALEGLSGRPGLSRLRSLLDAPTFALTDSDLERRLMALVRVAGLPSPETQARVNGFRVDFYWPGLGLVVETDGLRYHRTPAQQRRDRLRDQTHTAAGLTTLRFTAAQVRFEATWVKSTLKAVADRLDGRGLNV
jgi:very-short-patch-repair endonuclease